MSVLMSTAIPSVIKPTDCCQPSCADQTATQIPGPKGDTGANGTNGTDGVDSFTTTTAQFIQPAINSTVVVATVDSTWIGIGQKIFVENGGYYEATAVAGTGLSVTLKNLGYTGNAAPAAAVAPASKVSPGGIKGTDGSAAGITLNSISPTTAKGDLIVDNGAGAGSASDVKFSVGSNGKSLVADSSQATGLNYATITPNSATDNAIARYDGASGTPVPLQTSKVIVTDNGAVQASGSGGNARGTDAVDLQVTRALVTQVASGTDSAILGGKNNTASALCATVAGGQGNTASGQDDFVGGGNGNTASGTESAVCAGNGNVASGTASSITGGSNNTASGLESTAGGDGNTASGDFSSTIGGTNAVANKYAQKAHSSGAFATPGDSQKSDLIWFVVTADATANVEMFLDGSVARATIGTDRTWGFEIILVGRASTGVSAVWRTTGALQNNAGTVSLVAAVSTAVLADGTGTTWGVAGNFVVSADNTNKALHLDVTGAGATTIRWTAHAKIIEVGH